MATIIAYAFTLVAVDTERTAANPVLVGLDMPDTLLTTGTLVVVRVSTLPSTTAVVCVSAGKRHEHVNRSELLVNVVAHAPQCRGVGAVGGGHGLSAGTVEIGVLIMPPRM
jgi:hypothetical protein